MSYLLASLCLALCLTGSLGLPMNVGTGNNCVKATDASGGPTCKASQEALCCDATETSQNCQISFGMSCATGSLSPFCCASMDVEGAHCLAPFQEAGDTGDFDKFCCKSSNQAGGVDCVNVNTGLCDKDDYPGRPVFCD